MKANLKQLEEMQKELFRQQCDLDIQKAMVKHFIKKKQAEQLTLTDVVVPKGTFYCWDGAVGEQVCEKQCVDCKNENEGKLQQ
jgi:hypothetical protein